MYLSFELIMDIKCSLQNKKHYSVYSRRRAWSGSSIPTEQHHNTIPSL